MNTNCLDIGIIQAFLDGELSGGELTRVSDHIGDCDSCAMLLAQAEDENAVVFPALAREFDTLVPTQRLWARIEDSIEVEKASAPWYEKLYAIVIAGIASPSIAVAAGLLIVAGIFTVFTLRRSGGNEIASNPTTISAPVSKPVVAPRAVVATDDRDVTPAVRPSVETASYRSPRRVAAEPAVYTTNRPAAVVADASYLPGEKSYVSTIASLSKSVNGDEDPNVMRASERVSYERDMAVVDDNIKRMRAAVKKNPKNEAAKQMLSTAYQNKIDLLNSVAQKEELVASLNR